MSKLIKLKEWVTLQEATQYLSGIFQEAISEGDLLRFGLDGHLKLSIYFVNGCIARPCFRIPISQAKVGRSLDGTHDVILGYPISPGEVLDYNQNPVRIDGVWDLPMVRGEINAIEEKFHDATGGPKVTGIDVHGVFVENANGVLVQLLSDYADTEFQHFADGKKYLDPERYFPACRFPEDAMIVIRTSELRVFQQKVSDYPGESGGAMQTTERIALDQKTGIRPTAISDNTLISVIAALLANWPNGKPPSGKDLERAAASVGVSISDDSIRKALKAARELAPTLPAQ